MIIKIMIIRIAINIPKALDHHLENQLNAAKAKATPTARRNI